MPCKAIPSAVVCLFLSVAVSVAPAAERTIPKPLPGHPGNVFLAGEEVTVDLPAAGGDAWQAVDYDGRVVDEGRGAGRILLGQLPVGYYEIRRPGKQADRPPPVSIAVLAPLRAHTPESSPVASDVAMAWFYPPPKMSAAANLCALAGVNWVRDRLNWRDIEKQRGTFEASGRYDASAAAQAAAGLKVLQVNHVSPPWAQEPRRFPDDLRDAYRFYREMARRWQGKVLAFEPWNEADCPTFGGHTGSEIATMQKASYLGLKAGATAVIACQNVFAIHRRTTLDDFQANRAWPYFDTYNLHNYEAFDKYAAAFADHRAVSAGRPLWVTETSLPVPWAGDKSLQEPAASDLRTQAERVAKTYALSIYEGAAEVFYFILGHYVEGQTQFGLLRRDLTPRPGYLALAAVGRLLAGARPLGQLKTGDPAVHAFAFRARPDGNQRTVLVAWTDGPAATLNLPGAPLEGFDHLGRARPQEAAAVKLSAAPLFILLADQPAAKLDLAPPPQPAPWLDGKPSPVVLQVVLPQSRVALEESAYRITSGKSDRIPLYVYNFGPDAAQGRLTLRGPKDWKPGLRKTVHVAAGDRVSLGLTLDVPASAAGIQTITIEGDFGRAGTPVLSMRFLSGPP